MRKLLTLLLLLAPTLPAAAAASPEEASWIGKSREQVEHTWGEPYRVKRDGRGGYILFYRIRFLSNKDMRLSGTVTYDDAGTGPSILPEDPARWQHETFEGGTVMTPEPHPAVVGKRKARFRVDAGGRIYDSRIGPMKWKKGYRPEGDGGDRP